MGGEIGGVLDRDHPCRDIEPPIRPSGDVFPPGACFHFELIALVVIECFAVDVIDREGHATAGVLVTVRDIMHFNRSDFPPCPIAFGVDGVLSLINPRLDFGKGGFCRFGEYHPDVLVCRRIVGHQAQIGCDIISSAIGDGHFHPT